MTTMTTTRCRTLAGIALVALGAFVAARAAPSQTVTVPPASTTLSKRSVAPRSIQPDFSVKHRFYEAYLTPRMLARFPDENAVAGAGFANPAWNAVSYPLTQDPAAVARVQKGTIRAIESAFKGYAIERLGIDRFSFPVAGGNGRGRAALADDSRGVRVHLGFSHLAPRADLLIPITSGRLVVSADVRGRIGTTFAPASSRLRLAADLDVPERTAMVRLSLRF